MDQELTPDFLLELIAKARLAGRYPDFRTSSIEHVDDFQRAAGINQIDKNRRQIEILKLAFQGAALMRVLETFIKIGDVIKESPGEDVFHGKDGAEYTGEPVDALFVVLRAIQDLKSHVEEIVETSNK